MEEITTLAAPVSIQDYIIDIEEAKQKPSVVYQVVLENNTDFIVRRETVKQQRELVILISQGLYYFRDCKSGAIDPVTNANLRNFLRDVKDSFIKLQKVSWLNALYKESADFITTVIEDPVLTDMCRHNIPVNAADPRQYVSYWEQNKKLFMRIGQLFPEHTSSTPKYQNSIPVIFWIEEHYGANDAVYFAEKLAQSGVRNFVYSTRYYYGANKDIEGFIDIVESGFNINLRRFIDYICFDLYRQGYGEVKNTFFTEYFDYLSMQKDFYGKIREKYPENFKTAHDVMALKVNLTKLAEQCENFSEQAAKVKDLEFTAMGYSIVIPMEPRELAEEGINLSHCVGDYVDRVASGDCHILFLRRECMPEQSLVTLQLSGNSIIQAQGLNRRSMSMPERRFLERWAKEKNIDIMV